MYIWDFSNIQNQKEKEGEGMKSSSKIKAFNGLIRDIEILDLVSVGSIVYVEQEPWSPWPGKRMTREKLDKLWMDNEFSEISYL